MPRLVYLTGVAIGLLAVAFALTGQLLGPASGVTEANVRRIRPGMTLEAVQALLGGRGQGPMSFGWGSACFAQYTWAGPGGRITVCFSARDSFGERLLRTADEGFRSARFHPAPGGSLRRLLPGTGRPSAQP